MHNAEIRDILFFPVAWETNAYATASADGRVQIHKWGYNAPLRLLQAQTPVYSLETTPTDPPGVPNRPRTTFPRTFPRTFTYSFISGPRARHDGHLFPHEGP